MGAIAGQPESSPKHYHPASFLSEDQAKLVIYLKDTTYDDSLLGAGYVAIGDYQPEGFYLTTLYHEWFIIDYDTEAKALFGKEES